MRREIEVAESAMPRIPTTGRGAYRNLVEVENRLQNAEIDQTQDMLSRLKEMLLEGLRCKPPRVNS